MQSRLLQLPHNLNGGQKGTDMHTTGIGRHAEQAASEYLQQQGYRILARNWRRRDCEIDIVASREGIAYCVEVKYRASDRNGRGFEAIDHRKLQQMAYAARCWVMANSWRGSYNLAAIELGGSTYAILAFIDCIEN